MDVKLTYETEETKWGDERTELIIQVDGEEIARGSYGGEPEDNSHYRDYDWVRRALEVLAKKLGHNVILSEAKVERKY